MVVKNHVGRSFPYSRVCIIGPVCVNLPALRKGESFKQLSFIPLIRQLVEMDKNIKIYGF